MKKRYAFLILSCCNAFSAPLSLSPQQVAEMVVKNSNQAKEINLKSELDRLAMAQAMAVFDLTLSAETGLEQSKFQNLGASSGSQKDDTLTTKVNLKKPFATGTVLGFEFSRTNIKYEYPVGYTTGTGSVPNSMLAQDYFGLTFEQSIWKNFFGRSDRAKIKSAELNYSAAQKTRQDELQNLVLQALKSYWATFVASQSFQEALNSRDRYNKLVEAVRKKTSYGYSAPGELSQVRAELEMRNQRIKSESTTYLAAVDDLVRLLSLPPGTEIKFNFNQAVAPPPIFPPVDIDQLRPLQALKMKQLSAENSLISSASLNSPDITLVGKYYQSGLDTSASAAYSDMTSGSHPKYYVGMKFSHTFGSDLPSEDYLNKKMTSEMSSIQLSRTRLEMIDKLNHLQRKAQSSYAIVESTKLQRQHREKASQELNRAYAQGRTDISNLIRGLNEYFDSEIQYSKALGDYHMSLNEWAAARDELIPKR